MAGNTELLDEIADLGALEKQKQSVLASLKEIKDAFQSIGKIEISGKAANVNFSTTIKNLNDFTKAQENAAKSTEKLSTSQARLAAETAKAQTQVAKSREAAAKAAIAEQKAADGVERSTTKTNNASREAVRAYKSLSREYVILKKVAEDYGASLGTQSKQYLEAAKRANDLNDKLKAIDAGIGNSQRNVGNYASGFSGLGNSINQVTRELPAFTNSLQTGFLAISNNLPILFDEIGKTKRQITELRKAGEPAPSLFKAIAGSFFTLGTALSLGVTALTIFGPQIASFVAALFKGREALDQFTEKQKILGETLKNGGLKDAVANVNELRINIDLAKQGFLDKDEVVKQYNKTIGETTGKVSSLDEAEKELVKNGDAYIKMTLYKAAAQLALEKAADKSLQAALTRQKNAKEFETFADRAVSTPIPEPGKKTPEASDFQKKFIEAQGKKRREAAARESEKDAKVFEDIAKEFQTNAAKISKDFNFDFFGGDDKSKGTERLRTATKKLFQDELTDYQKLLEDLANSDQQYVTGRIAFRRQAAEVERQILEEQRQLALDNATSQLNDVLKDSEASANAKINAESKYNAEVAGINQEFGYKLVLVNKKREADIVKIKADSIAKQKAQDDALYSDLVAANQKAEAEIDRSRKARQELDQSKLENDKNQLLANLDADFAKVDRRRSDFAKKEREYQIRKLDIQNEYQVKQLQSQIAYAEQSIAIEKARAIASGDKTALDAIAQAEEALYGLKIKLSAQAADFQIKRNQAVTEDAKKNVDEQIAQLTKIRDTAFAFADAIGQLIRASSEAEKNRLQEQIDLIEKKKQAEIEAINASSLSEQEKADKISILNARAAAQREQLELKQRQAEQRNARFQKTISVAKAIADTALAVLNAIKTGDPYTAAARAAIIGAIGAAQIAAIIATPIPKYATGTTDHPGGLAITGDGGRKEAIMTPDGRISISPAKATVMDLPKGTIVHPDAEAFMRLANMPLSRLNDGKVNDPIMAEMMKKQVDAIGRVEQAIMNKTENHWYPGKLRTKNGNNFTTYINKSVFE